MSKVDDMPGYLTALAAAATASATAFCSGVQPLLRTDAYLCSPDISQWLTEPLWGFAAQALLLWAVSIAAIQLNRRCNLEPGTSALPATFFLIATAAVPAVTVSLSSASLLAAAVVLALRQLLPRADSGAARELFLTASAASFGAMTQYAFIPLAIALIPAAAILGQLNAKALAAYLMGLAAPWAIILGFGAVSPFEIRLPEVWENGITSQWAALAAAALTALTGIVLMARAAMTPQTRSTLIMRQNRAIGTLLTVMTLAMAADYTNFAVYVPSVSLLTGFFVAGITSENTNASPTPLILTLSAVYTALYVMQIMQL